MQLPPSRILYGLNALRRDNPWPEFPYGEIAPFHLALDGGRRAGRESGGGREIIIKLIQERGIELMVEVGCFLGGSTLTWLRASEKLSIIGVDPWDGNWAAYIEHMAVDPLKVCTVFHLTEAEIASIVGNIRKYGNFAIAMNNLRLYKHRFIPVRQRSPDALHYLKMRQITPQLLYIDAGKEMDDLEVAYKLFPETIICGDDWLWPDETGVMRMQENVKTFAARHNFEIQHSRQSWVLLPPTKPKAKAPAIDPAAAAVNGNVRAAQVLS